MPKADNGVSRSRGILAELLLLLLERGALSSLNPLTGGCVENDLSKSYRLGSNLDELLVGDELDSFLKRKLNGSDESELFVSARGTNCSKVLFLTYVNLNVVRLGILTNYHALVNRCCRADKERSSVLSLEEAVGCGNTLFGCNER